MVVGAQSEDEAGRVVPFGKYLLDAMLAEGGMARVYRARLRGALGFEKPLVVKQVRPELARDPRFVAMFVEEAKTLVRLSHPHIVPVYELGVVDGIYFLAMELVDGATLASLMREGPLPPTLVARLGEQIAEALHHAHDRFGLVHRDVTPRNVLVDVEGHARLVDFGIATPAEGLAGEVFGSPGYMSPEQLRGESLDARSDLFALGAVLFQALAGHAAFLPDDLRGVDPKSASAAAKVATLAGRVPALPDEIPDALRDVVRACLAPDRNDRPTSAALVARELRTWLARAAPGGVGAELAARVRETVARHARPHDDPGPITVTSKKGEERSLATAAVLTHALEHQPRDEARVASARASVEGTAPVERTAPLDRPRVTPVDEVAPDVAGEGASASVASASIEAASPAEPTRTTEDAERSARRAEDSTQPIVRERRATSEPSSDTTELVEPTELVPSAATRQAPSPQSAGSVEPARPATPATPELGARPKASAKRLVGLGLAVITIVAVALVVRPAPEPVVDAPRVESPTSVDRSPEEPRVEPRVEATAMTATTTTTTTMSNESSDTAEAPAPVRGYVTVHATPWAEVQLDGRSLGTTPIRRTAIGAGSHVLVFENPPLGRTLRVPIRVDPGANVRVLADLSTDEPRARVR
jgi:serine/threonine protein kinase